MSLLPTAKAMAARIIAAVPRGARNLATTIFVPSSVGASVAATGAKLRVVRRPGGRRIVYAWPLGGAYHVFTLAK